jgi:hypothetical protein
MVRMAGNVTDLRLLASVCMPAASSLWNSRSSFNGNRIKECGINVKFGTLIRKQSFQLLAGSYTLNAIVFFAVSVHLVSLLLSRGIDASSAAWVAAVAGPMQVAGRFVEFTYGKNWKAAQTGALALSMMLPALFLLGRWPMPIAALLLGVGLYGISNGVMTIVRSLGVVEVFGRGNYATVSGALMGPAILSRAFGPLVASLMLTNSGSYGPVLLLWQVFRWSCSPVEFENSIDVRSETA